MKDFLDGAKGEKHWQGTDKNQGLAYILELLVSPLAKHGEGIDWHFIGHANGSQGKFLPTDI